MAKKTASKLPDLGADDTDGDFILDNDLPVVATELANPTEITSNDLEAICFYENPKLKLDRIETSTKKGGWINFFSRLKIISKKPICINE